MMMKSLTSILSKQKLIKLVSLEADQLPNKESVKELNSGPPKRNSSS